MQWLICTSGQVVPGLKSILFQLPDLAVHVCGGFSPRKRCQRMTSVRRLRVAQVHLCSDTLGALRGFCGCLLLGEPWVPEHVRCLCWNHPKDSQDVPWEVSWEVSDMLLSLKIQYQYKCSFCWRLSYENDLGKRFAITASFPEGASEIFWRNIAFRCYRAFELNQYWWFLSCYISNS